MPPLRLLTQGFKARPQLYARALPCFVRRPANRRRPFDFRSEQAIRTSRTYAAPRFLPQHSHKNASRRHFCRNFLFAKSSCDHSCALRRIMRMREIRRAAILRKLFAFAAARARVCALCARALYDPYPDGGKGFYRFFAFSFARICAHVRAHMCNSFIIIYICLFYTLLSYTRYFDFYLAFFLLFLRRFPAIIRAFLVHIIYMFWRLALFYLIPAPTARIRSKAFGFSFPHYL